MRKAVRWGAFGASAAAMLLIGVAAGIAQDKLAQVKERQDFMKAQGADVKAITGYSKGEGDQQAPQKAIDDLLARAPKIVAMFPPGTSAEDFPGKSNAKPEIWKNMDKVKAIPTALQGEEEKVKTAIESGDQKAVAAALGSMGKNGCGACHGTYREKTPYDKCDRATARPVAAAALLFAAFALPAPARTRPRSSAATISSPPPAARPATPTRRMAARTLAGGRALATPFGTFYRHEHHPRSRRPASATGREAAIHSGRCARASTMTAITSTRSFPSPRFTG